MLVHFINLTQVFLPDSKVTFTETMRFEKELRKVMVQAWSNKYVRYTEIKSKVKELKKLYEEYDFSNDGQTSERSRIPSPIFKASSLPESEQSREEFEAATKSLYNNQMDDMLNKRIHLVENSIDTSTFNRESNEEKQECNEYRFTNIASVIEPDLACKLPTFESKHQDIKFKEREICLLVEQDIFKVCKFYADQCVHFAEQHNALIARVDILRQKQNLKHRNGQSIKRRTYQMKNPICAYYFEKYTMPCVYWSNIDKLMKLRLIK